MMIDKTRKLNSPFQDSPVFSILCQFHPPSIRINYFPNIHFNVLSSHPFDIPGGRIPRNLYSQTHLHVQPIATALISLHKQW
jgi:hypothetical protein